MANFNRDNVEIVIPDAVLPIVKGWLEKADSKIAELNKDSRDLQANLDNQIKAFAVQADELKKAKQDLEIATGKEQALTAEVELLKKQLEDSLSDDRIIERRQVERIALAASVINADALDTLSTKALKEKVVSGRWGASVIQGKNEDALNAMFEIAAKEISDQSKKTSTSSQAHQNNLRALDDVMPVVQDSLDDELQKVLAKVQSDNQNSWKAFLKEVR